MTTPFESTFSEGKKAGGLTPDSQLETAAQSPEEGKLAAERSANLGPVVVQGYEVLEEVGRGMMGVVYKARDIRLNRLVALKVVQGESAPDSRMLIRFLAEAEAVAAIKHPNVVQVYEFGDSNGRPYLALEFLPGGTLAKRLRTSTSTDSCAHQLDPISAAKLIAKIARGVQAAHDQGIVHRDLKPGNVLFDETGEPRVTDFGIAKRNTGIELTQTHAVMGTPAYMAPEQARGGTKFVGPQADVFAMGVMLYEAITASRPFEAPDTISLLRKVAEEDPSPPRLKVPALSRDLDLICMKCLEKDARRRYLTARDLADDLERFLEGRPIMARPTGMVEFAWKHAKRNPIAAALAVGCLLIALIGFAGVVWKWQDAEGQKTRAVEAESLTTTRLNEAVTARAEAHSLRQAADQRSARLAAERGQVLCEQGDVESGLIWLVRSLELADQTGDAALQGAVRKSLAAWAGQLVRPLPAFRHGTLAAVARFTPDGKEVVTISNDGFVRRWNPTTGLPQGEPWRHPFAVPGIIAPRFFDLAVGPHGEVLVAAARGMAWLSRKADAGRSFVPLIIEAIDVWSAAFNADGSRGLTGSSDGKARLWDIATGRSIGPGYSHGTQVSAIAFHTSGKIVATAGWDGQVCLWDTETFERIGQPLAHVIGEKVLAVTFSPDGRWLASGGRDSTVKIWDVKTRTMVGEPIRHSQFVAALDFSPDGTTLATGAYDGIVRLWDTATWRLNGTLRHSEVVRSVHFQPGTGRSLVAAGSRGAVRSWQLPERLSKGSPLEVGSPVHTVAFSPDSATLLTASRRGGARLWDAARGEPRGQALKLETWLMSASLASDDRTVAVGDWNGGIRTWDGLSNSRAGSTLDQNGEAVDFVRFAPNGKTLIAFIGARNSVRIRDVASNKTTEQKLSFETVGARSAEPKTAVPSGTESSPMQLFTLSHDGTVAFFGGEDGMARQWSLTKGATVGPSLPHGDWVLSAAFEPKDKTVLTGCRDGSARLWDLSTGRMLLPPLHHSAPVESVAFDHTGTILLTGTTDGALRFWDATTGLPLGPQYSHPGGVLSIAVAINGSQVATACQDGYARFWKTLPEPMAESTERIKLWAQLATGLVLDDNNGLQFFSEMELADRRLQLTK